MLPLFAPLIQLFLTVYYFFYFLAKGKPEWKCGDGKHEDEAAKIEKVCCDGDASSPSSPLYTPRYHQKESGVIARVKSIPSSIRIYWRRFVDWIKSFGRRSSIYSPSTLQRLKNGLRRLGAGLIAILKWTWQTVSTFLTSLFSFLLLRRAPSKTMPTSDAIYHSRGKKEEGKVEKKDEIHASIVRTPVPFPASLPSDTPLPSSSSISSPPPPPPPPPPALSIRSNTNRDIETKDGKKDESGLQSGAFYTTRVFSAPSESDKKFQKEVKGGIAVFPPSMMAEIAGSGGGSEGLSRSEINRSPNPTVRERLREASLTPTHNRTFEYGSVPPPSTRPAPYEYQSMTTSRVDTPKGWGSEMFGRTKRAQSAGPPRVSRIEDSANNEAQFIFRAHGSNDEGGYNSGMGSSMYNSIGENSTMRSRRTMNREMESRPTTPSVWSCNTSRMSTPAPIAREEEGVQYGRMTPSIRGKVGDSARRWPPPPNAEGADIGKESFIDGNGVITTACTRIVQKKNEESWRWFDDNGRMIDEKSEFTLMGDRDEVRRGGPYQANHYSQHYFVDRDGCTRFENTHRQYNRDYVVESVCRNY